MHWDFYCPECDVERTEFVFDPHEPDQPERCPECETELEKTAPADKGEN